MLNSPHHRRILALLLVALLLSAWFWGGPLLAWTHQNSTDIQTLAALFGVPLAILGLVLTILQFRGSAIGKWADEQAQIAERQARDLLLTRISEEVTQRLDTSLYRQVQIVLARRLDRTLIASATHRTLERPGQPPIPVPPGTPTSDLFDQVGGALLILGEPGAGKTVELLTLAAALLERARRDQDLPVPVIFNLSGWAIDRLPLAGWMAVELARQFGGGRKIWAARIAQSRILPLLDGLDEVAAEHRTACARAIDAYRDTHDLCRLAVCCRALEYRDLPDLKLQAALLIQPLDRGQIERYLIDAGRPLAGLRQAIARDPELAGLAANPLMLHVMSLTYEDRPCEAILTPTATTGPGGAPDLGGRRDSLFAAYLDRAFQRKRATATRWSEARTRRYLIRLAYEMKTRELSPFLIEELQPDWSGRWGMLLAWFVVFPAVGLSVLVMEDILRWLFFRVSPAIDTATMWFAVTCFLIVALLWAKLIAWSKIKRTDNPRWSLRKLVTTSRLDLTIGLIVLPVIFGLGLVLHSWVFDFSRIAGAMIGTSLGIAGGLLFFGIENRNIECHYPNAGVATSIRNGVRFAVIGIPFTLAFNIPALFQGSLSRVRMLADHGVIGIVVSGFVIGFLFFGGAAAIQHYILRLGLAIERRFPLDLIAFLDHATHLIILQRVGGGWRFIHRLLGEHLAAQDPRATRPPRRARAARPD